MDYVREKRRIVMTCTSPRQLNSFRSLVAVSLAATALLLFASTERSTAQIALKNLNSEVRPIVGKPAGFVPWTRKGMPPGSYLATPARSVAELVAQVDQDPALVIKYQRVFHDVTKSELRGIFRNLQLVQLQEDVAANVYYWHTGVAGFRVRKVKKGTWVFARKDDGRPVLVQVCGNPLTNIIGLPELLKPGAATSSIQEFLEDEPLPPRRTVVLDEMQMFDMGSIQLMAPKARNIDINVLPKPSIGRGALVTPVTPPIVPPAIAPPSVPANPIGALRSVKFTH